MSIPQNILSKFRTYSYHHVLAVADCTGTALELTESPVLSDAFTSRSPNDRLVLNQTKSGGNYIILIDGFVDARFVIQEVRWATVMAPEPGAAVSSTVETDGEMKIIEAQGVRFLNVLAQASTLLSSDPTGLIFVLKTIFVGHTDSGETEVITNIRPLYFIIIDIQGEFTEAGAEYKVGFVGMCNGAAKLPYVNEIASQVDITNRYNDQVVTNLQGVFENILPERVTFLYNQEKARLQDLYSKLNIQGSINDSYRDVTYKFWLDPAYHSYTFGTNEKLTKQNDKDDPILSFSENTTFENIIQGIMMSSKEVVEEASNEKEKYLFKITSSIESTREEYVVTYFVHRYKQDTPTVDSAVASGERFEPPPGSFITFDYIFTGRNIDIINFDIKMEMGLAFFHILGTTSNIPSQSEYLTPTEAGIAKGPGGAENAKANPEKNTVSRRLTPLFLGGQTRNAILRNKKLAVSSINFQSMMSRWAGIENIQAKMVIHGNPQLLDEMAVTPEDMRNGGTETPKEGETIQPGWMKAPQYVKVNIMMPGEGGAEDYAETFWFDGYYQLFFVNNIFSNGLFTQELEMFSIPYGDPSDKTSDEVKIQTATNEAPPPATGDQDLEEVTVTAQRLPVQDTSSTGVSNTSELDASNLTAAEMLRRIAR